MEEQEIVLENVETKINIEEIEKFNVKSDKFGFILKEYYTGKKKFSFWQKHFTPNFEYALILSIRVAIGKKNKNNIKKLNKK